MVLPVTSLRIVTTFSTVLFSVIFFQMQLMYSLGSSKMAATAGPPSSTAIVRKGQVIGSVMAYVPSSCFCGEKKAEVVLVIGTIYSKQWFKR